MVHTSFKILASLPVALLYLVQQYSTPIDIYVRVLQSTIKINILRSREKQAGMHSEIRNSEAAVVDCIISQ